MSKFFYLIVVICICSCRKDSSQEITRIVPDNKQEFLQKYSVVLNKYFMEYERRVIENYARRHHYKGEFASSGFFQENCRHSMGMTITPLHKTVIYGKIYSIDGGLIEVYNVTNPLLIQLNTSNDFVGLHKALNGKRVGEKWRFIFPSYLGYGQVGNGKNIGQNMILVAEVEIISCH